MRVSTLSIPWTARRTRPSPERLADDLSDSWIVTRLTTPTRFWASALVLRLLRISQYHAVWLKSYGEALWSLEVMSPQFVSCHVTCFLAWSKKTRLTRSCVSVWRIWMPLLWHVVVFIGFMTFSQRIRSTEALFGYTNPNPKEYSRFVAPFQFQSWNVTTTRCNSITRPFGLHHSRELRSVIRKNNMGSLSRFNFNLGISDKVTLTGASITDHFASPRDYLGIPDSYKVEYKSIT